MDFLKCWGCGVGKMWALPVKESPRRYDRYDRFYNDFMGWRLWLGHFLLVFYELLSEKKSIMDTFQLELIIHIYVCCLIITIRLSCVFFIQYFCRLSEQNCWKSLAGWQTKNHEGKFCDNGDSEANDPATSRFARHCGIQGDAGLTSSMKKREGLQVEKWKKIVNEGEICHEVMKGNWLNDLVVYRPVSLLKQDCKIFTMENILPEIIQFDQTDFIKTTPNSGQHPTYFTIIHHINTRNKLKQP